MAIVLSVSVTEEREITVLSCPFCGGDNVEIGSDGDDMSMVTCHCGARGPASDRDKEAIDGWNTRSKPMQQELKLSSKKPKKKK